MNKFNKFFCKVEKYCLKSLIIFGFFMSIFCFIPLPIILYYTAEYDATLQTTISIFTIDWTILGILVAFIGICAPYVLKEAKPSNNKKKFILFILMIYEMALVLIQLALASTIIFSGNERLFTILVYSSLYFLSMIILYTLSMATYIFILPLITEERKQQ